MRSKENNHGSQPLDALLNSLAYTNDDLVKSSGEQLTHKQVQKARKGKRVTANIKGKITRALNAFAGEERFKEVDLFNAHAACLRALPRQRTAGVNPSKIPRHFVPGSNSHSNLCSSPDVSSGSFINRVLIKERENG